MIKNDIGSYIDKFSRFAERYVNRNEMMTFKNMPVDISRLFEKIQDKTKKKSSKSPVESKSAFIKQKWDDYVKYVNTGSNSLTSIIEYFKERGLTQEESCKMYMYLKKGEIETIMIYDINDADVIIQFNHFKNYIGISFLINDVTNKEIENTIKIAGRILPVDIKSERGQKLVEEAKAWSKKLKDPSLEIKTLPTYLDFKTHEIVGRGFLPERPLKDMLNKKKLPMRREAFVEQNTEKAKKNIKNFKEESCSKVACTLPQSYDVKPLKKEERMKK